MSDGTPQEPRPSTGDTFSHGEPWPPYFPHDELDALMRHVREVQTSDTAEVEQMIRSVSMEAHRLRTAVTRLSETRLRAAEREAGEILTEARIRALEISEQSMVILNRRLHRAEEIMDSLKQTMRQYDVPDPDDPR